MDPDNPEVESDIANRLMASFEPEEAPEAAPEAEESQEIQPEETEAEVEDTAAEAEFVEVEDDDGTQHRVPAKLKDAFLRHADYTRKTMDAANLAKAAQDRIQYAEAREQFSSAVFAEIAEIKAMQAQLKQYEGLDKATLYAQDPGTALRVRDQEDALRRQIAEREQQVSGKARQIEQMVKQHQENQWRLAVDGARQRIGQYTPGEDAAMLKQVELLGITLEEMRGRFADPRVLHAIYKAAKWDVLQANKGQAVQTAQAAPPVLKPGARNANAAASKEKSLRSQLKKSGDYRDAAKLLLLKGM